jgi:hypothetical protein
MADQSGTIHGLICFYLKEVPNSDGRFLEEIWQWSDQDWEEEHDFVQWLFPLEHPSAFNADAPLLDENAIRQWYKDKLLQHNLRTSYERWLHFCGIAKVDGKLHLVDRKPNVWGGMNHNWLRITRVLRSLTLLGLKPEANQFFDLLTDLRDCKKLVINDTTFIYWERAVTQ